MFRNVIWERLVCLSGVVAAFIGTLAIDVLRQPYSREPPSGFPTNLFEFAQTAGVTMAIVGGIGWYLTSRTAARLDAGRPNRSGIADSGGG